MNALLLGWFCADKQKPTCQRIAEAAARFAEKFGEPARVALVNQADECECEGLGVEVRVVGYVQPSNYWVGVEEVA